MRQRVRTTSAGVAAVILAALACFEPTPAPVAAAAAGSEPARVLFIGNSLTAANDLPGMVAALAAAAGDSLAVSVVTAPGASLEDHWTSGRARGAFEQTPPRHVIMQQGPSTLSDSRAHLIEWSQRFADLARSHGAVPHLYMVWPPRSGDWERGAESYRLSAEASRSGLFPVAEAFQAAWRRDPALELLAGDDFHPSPLGSYLAALVIVAQLQERPASELADALPERVTPGPAVAALLQAAADEAIAESGR